MADGEEREGVGEGEDEVEVAVEVGAKVEDVGEGSGMLCSQSVEAESWRRGGTGYFRLGQWKAWCSFLHMMQICSFEQGLLEQSSCQDHASQI